MFKHYSPQLIHVLLGSKSTAQYGSRLWLCIPKDRGVPKHIPDGIVIRDTRIEVLSIAKPQGESSHLHILLCWYPKVLSVNLTACQPHFAIKSCAHLHVRWWEATSKDPKNGQKNLGHPTRSPMISSGKPQASPPASPPAVACLMSCLKRSRPFTWSSAKCGWNICDLSIDWVC